MWDNLPSFQLVLDYGILEKVNLKRHVVCKNGKQHVYYSLSETIRINKNRTVQGRVLNLGELNTTQTEQWQRSIEVIEGCRVTPIVNIALKCLRK
jgi:hypothetical protein